MTDVTSDRTPAAAGSSPEAPHPPRTETAGPAALALARSSRRDLERAFHRGSTPELAGLVGWEFRGINCTPRREPPLARLARIQKFVKGVFRAEDGRVMGYNSPVAQGALTTAWRVRPSDAAPKRFGFYEVSPVDPTSRDNHYLHALLLDYGKGGNPRWDITRGLRDYVVQVAPDNPDLLLGKAYYAVGPGRVALGYFVLERWRRAATTSAHSAQPGR